MEQHAASNNHRQWSGDVLGDSTAGEQLEALRLSSRAALRLDVAVMRDLGVAEWKDIVLFPPVHKPEDIAEMTDEERKAATKAAKEEYEALLFASSGT